MDAKTVFTLFGSISNLLILSNWLRLKARPVLTQVSPPFVDLKTPTDVFCKPSESPVAMYITSVFVGLITMSETPRFARSSPFGVHVVPPFIVFQMPPAGLPT